MCKIDREYKNCREERQQLLLHGSIKDRHHELLMIQTVSVILSPFIYGFLASVGHQLALNATNHIESSFSC